MSDVSPHLPDLDTDGARAFFRDPPLSKISIYGWAKLARSTAMCCAPSAMEASFLIAYRERRIAKGPQFDQIGIGKKRPRGRPRKHPKPEAAAASAE